MTVKIKAGSLNYGKHLGGLELIIKLIKVDFIYLTPNFIYGIPDSLSKVTDVHSFHLDQCYYHQHTAGN